MNSPSPFAEIQSIQEDQREGWTPETITPTAMNTTDQTYHTPNVVQQRREEAATINAAMNPAPAGKLTDEQLGEIGAKAAAMTYTDTATPKEYFKAIAAAVREAVEKDQQQGVDFLSSDKRGDWTEDFAHENGNYMCNCCECGKSFMGHKRRAVCKICVGIKEGIKQAEEIVRLAAILDQAIEMVNTPGTTKDNLPKAINAKIMQRDEFHDATLKRLDDAKTEISRIKAEYESLLKVYKNADEGARNMHNELKRLQSASRMCTADMDSLKDQLTKANAELERLRWRPVSVKPTREDADASGNVEVITPKGRILLRMFSSWPWELNHTTAHEVSHWRSFCLPAPTAEEKERAEFEKSCVQFDVSFTRDEGGNYRDSRTLILFEVWQLACASKEVKE